MATVRISDLIRCYDDHGLVHITPSRAIRDVKRGTWHRTSGSRVALCTMTRSPGQPIPLRGDEVPHYLLRGSVRDVVTTCLWCVAIEGSMPEWETDG